MSSQPSGSGGPEPTSSTEPLVVVEGAEEVDDADRKKTLMRLGCVPASYTFFEPEGPLLDG